MEPSDAGRRPLKRGGIATAAAVGLGLLLAGCWGSPAPRPDENPKGAAPKFTAGKPLVFPAERTPATCAVWATLPSGTESSASMARGEALGTMSGAAPGSTEGAVGPSVGQESSTGTAAGAASGTMNGVTGGAPGAAAGALVDAGLYRACLQADAR